MSYPDLKTKTQYEQELAVVWELNKSQKEYIERLESAMRARDLRDEEVKKLLQGRE